jgi:ABC-type multidrug transport system fused ATPase/permease subunit
MKSDLSTARKILSLLTRTEGRELLVLLGFILIGMVAEALGVGLVMPAIVLLTVPEDVAGLPARHLVDALGDPRREMLVVAGMALLVLVFVLKNAFLATLAWRQTRFTYGLGVQLARRLFRLYLSQPYTFHLQRNSVHLISSLTGDVEQVALGAASALTLVAESVVLVGLATLLALVEPLATVAVGLVVWLAAWTFLRMTRGMSHRWALARQYHGEMSFQHLQQGFGAVKDVILSGRPSEFVDRYVWHSTRRALAAQKHDTIRQLPRLFLEVLGVAAIAAMAAMMLAEGRRSAVLLPTLGVVAAAAFRIFPSLNRILYGLQLLRFAAPSIDRVHAEFTVLDGVPPRRAKTGPRFSGAVELVDVTYTYPAAAGPALRGVSMRIGCGESIGIIGPSGAGKSTLVNILLGLLVPDEGRVLVDGRDMRGDPGRWQGQIGYVPQSIYVMDDTVRRNVAFGLPDEDIDDAAVRSALGAAGLLRLVGQLPHGLDTVLGERGIRISGGELQRIGIARALYHDPAVVVFDEATSSLDIATEQEVMASVHARQGRRTIVIVSHRPTAIEHCDRIYELVGGQLVVGRRAGKGRGADAPGPAAGSRRSALRRLNPRP